MPLPLFIALGLLLIVGTVFLQAGGINVYVATGIAILVLVVIITLDQLIHTLNKKSGP